jgi:hypothetical protein
MPTRTNHHTRVVNNTTDPATRAILTSSQADGVITNTRFEITPLGTKSYGVRVEQFERKPRHKRGVSRSLSFIISREGLNHLCGVED